jgi:hypothetical protein
MRLYLYAAAAMALLALFWHDRHVTKRLESTKAALSVAEATITAERENTRKANEASNQYQASLRDLERERANVPVVRLCRPPSAVSARPAAGRPDATAAGHVGEAAAGDPVEAVGPDIGAELLAYGIDCEANALQLERLQGWIRNR